MAVERELRDQEMALRAEVAAWNRHLFELLMRGEAWSPREIAMARDMTRYMAVGVQAVSDLKGAAMRAEMREHVTGYLADVQ